MGAARLISRGATFIGRALMVGGFAFALWLGVDLAIFCERATAPANSALRQKADAIAVYTGKSDARVQAGVDLLEADHAPLLLISGVYAQVTKAEMARVAGGGPDLYQCCITLGRRAEDTMGNAAETADWAKGRGIDTLILVTEHFHMRRALLETHARLPNTKIIPVGVADAPYAGADWLNNRAVLRGLLNEYAKGWGALLRLYLSLDVGAKNPANATQSPQ